MRMLVVEMMDILERDGSRQAILADNEWKAAMGTTYARGINREQQRSGMFDVPGL